MRRHIRWPSIRRCVLIVDTGEKEPLADIFASCGAYIHVFLDYERLGEVIAPGVIISNDIVFEQVIGNRIQVWSYVYGQCLVKDCNYRKRKYGNFDQKHILRSISAFGALPWMDQAKVITMSRRYHYLKGGWLGRFWQREAGREKMARIRIGEACPGKIGEFDGLAFLSKWERL